MHTVQISDIPLDTEEMYEAHRGLIQYVINRIVIRLPSDIDRDDLFQEGALGLLDAVRKFDPKFGASFKTYAERRIMGSALDYLRKQDWTPRSMRNYQRRFERARGQLEQQRMGRVYEDEIANSVGLAPDAFRKIQNVAESRRIVNFGDILIGGGGKVNDDGSPRNFEEIIPSNDDDPLACVLRRSIAEDNQKRVQTAVDALSDKERSAVVLYFYSELNEDQIGAVLGVTESRVCQLMDRGLLKIQKRLRSMGFEPD